jgi:hypothetical protein
MMGEKPSFRYVGSETRQIITDHPQGPQRGINHDCGYSG